MEALSRLEREVDALDAGNALICGRSDLYDPMSGLFYSPLQYSQLSLSGATIRDASLPSDGWVQEAFESLVRQEFGRTELDVVSVPRINVAGKLKCDAADTFRAARDQMESLVYGPQLERVIAQTKGASPEEQLYHLLSLPQYLGKSLNRFFSEKAFSQLLGNRSDPRSGIRILVPALPFRDQNPFRTTDAPYATTLSEVLFLLRLHIMALAIYQIVPTGSHCIVVADGTAYAEALGVPAESAVRYFEGLRSVRSALNLHGTVSIVDLRELMRSFDVQSNGEPISELVTSSIHDSLVRLRESGQSSAQFTALEQGIRWNLNLTDFCNTKDRRKQTWEWLNTSSKIIEGSIFNELSEFSERACLEYAAINLTEKFLEVIARRLPGCIRATTHPKSGQLPIPRRGSVSAWNGVAHMDSQGDLVDCETDPLYRLTKRPLTAFVDRDYPNGTVYYGYGLET